MLSIDKNENIFRTKHGEFTVSSNGRVVFVHNKVFVAKFCSSSIDFLPKEWNGYVLDTTKFGDTLPTIKEWNRFKDIIKNEYGVLVSDDHKPMYIK